LQNGPLYNWEIDHGDPSDPDSSIFISISPHSGLISKWRIILPAEYEGTIDWGIYIEKSNEIIKPRGIVETEKIIMQDGLEVIVKGGVESISKSKPAKIIVKNPPPHFIAFGFSEDENSPPKNIEGITFEDHPH
tara:strand:- start:10162 stop:10563 length:402 start_codon:yes stop_codon:yes gene_type:complete